MRIRLVTRCLVVFLAVSASWADPLGTAFTYQGRLKNGGSPANGTFNMDFKLYPVPAGGTLLASQTLPGVSVSDGLFTVQLDFGAGMFNGTQRWLEVTVNGSPLVPRQELKAAPYAHFALNADRLDGLDSTAFLTGIPNPLSLAGSNNSHIIAGHNNSSVNGASGFFGSATAASGQTYGVHGHSASTNGFGVFGVSTSTTGPSRGGFFESASSQGIGVLGLAKATTGGAAGVYGQSDSPSGYGVYSNGNMHATGVISGNASGLTNFPVPFSLTGSGAHVFSAQNTSPDSGTAVLGLAAASTGTTSGGRFESASDEGMGVLGLATTTMANGYTSGVHGQAASSIGRGVFGRATSTSGENYGVWGESDSNTGTGVYGKASSNSSLETYGVKGVSLSSEGIGVGGQAILRGLQGLASGTSGTGVIGVATNGTGTTYGVWAESYSNSGTGVYGKASNPNGVTYGLKGDSVSSTGRGVSGNAVRTGVEGFASSTTGFGVFGHATSTTGVNIGVYGATSSPSGWGVLSFGNSGASGTKSFRIDHPFDPENKYLLHYAAESPMPQNFYVGNVVTDAKGYAWVELPDYFSEINVNFKYQLTVISGAEDFVQAMVSKKVQANRFQVRTSAPNTEVSWRVDADRNDLYVRNRPPKDVVDKEGPEKGTYQHPEFYGQPPEKGMNYDAARERAEPVRSATQIASDAAPR